MSLRLWELAGLAIDVLIVLAIQVAFMAAFAIFVLVEQWVKITV